jgi:hypothetical protein
VYEPQYLGAATLLPSPTPLSTIYATNQLPLTALFSSTPPASGNPQLDALLAVPNPAVNPVGYLGFGTSNLITNSYRLEYAADAATHPDELVFGTGLLPAANPQFPIRQDLKLNDMRSWAPHSPVLMCGGTNDPTVFFKLNTKTMQAYWSQLPAGLVNVLDLEATPTGAFAPLQGAFQHTIAGIVAQGGESALLPVYHSTVAPFCTTAARGFFEQVLATLPPGA